MKTTVTEIITIGNEILIGQITDTNSQWISAELTKIGIPVVRKSSIGDKEEDILTILDEAKKRASIIILTGGLGPTNDDITKKTLAAYFNSPLVVHEEALRDLSALFERRGKILSDINKTQALLPSICTYLPNANGTAPGMWFQDNDTVVISLAGVPYEMKEIMSNQVLPRLKNHFKTPVIIHKHIQTVGIGESVLAEKISNWENNLPEYCSLAYLPSYGSVKLRLTAVGKNAAELDTRLASFVTQLTPLIEEYIFNYSEDSLEKTIGILLKEKSLTIAAAESCTGGYLSHLFTSIPGSSAYFKGSVVAYHNEIKTSFTTLSIDEINQHGAVSEHTVLKMAAGIREKFGTSIGVASSGIAGPDGGTPEKPVGTIWIAYSDDKKTFAKKLLLTTNRELNIRLTANYLLDTIRKAI